MKFAQALEALQSNKKVARQGWNGKDLSLQLQIPDVNSKMTLPYIFMRCPASRGGPDKVDLVPWTASQTDILSDDWVVV